MGYRLIEDWTVLAGVTSEIQIDGLTVCAGIVDAVTDDGTILWIQPRTDSRRMYEKTTACQAWAEEENLGKLAAEQTLERQSVG